MTYIPHQNSGQPITPAISKGEFMLSNDSFEWNRESLRSLRLRLGWSKSDLARRLGCSAIEVEAWEDGTTSIEAVFRSQLEIIYFQAESCSNEVKLGPSAENECDRNSLSQVDFSRVKADLE